jgi:hypothetical protein
MSRKLLVVDTDLSRARQLARLANGIAEVTIVSDFASARRVITTASPDFLVANLRLGPYNGLHLVHIASCVGAPVHSIVYTEVAEPGLGAEIQNAGAFYETLDHLRHALPTYLTSELPPQDRRDVWRTVIDASLPAGRTAGPHVASWFLH